MKKMQLAEMLFWSVIIFFAFMIVAIKTNVLPLQLIIIVKYSYLGFLVAFGGVLFFLYQKYSKNVFFNPISNIVELHIGRRGTSMKLFRWIRESENLAKEKNTSVIFYTSHFSEDRILKKFGDRVVISQTTLIQQIVYWSTYYLITFGQVKGKRYPLLKCEIVCN
ncbi:hypothetical protein [Mangrovibacillus cuniculi]|uniref:Uncharacterized protein n=1 Tax=Mangrovibacillus cuniculi TaxID=2593652 RepID=A0A7S8CBV6_9BACI|nr:hypothetical protein [Mangrovibacillus cuniculi]QPC47124.1 hypothetical protein G8O30_09170 [Mangrovibacillus cuniculi]